MEHGERPAALPVRHKGFAAMLLRLVFPPRCVFCGRRGCETNVCTVCEAQLTGLCVPEGYLREKGDPRWLHRVRAVWQYDGVVKRALLNLKYHKSRWRGPELSRQVAAHNAGLPAPDLIIPVPDHPFAAKDRPYSVPRLFAERLSRQSGAPAVTNILIKQYNTPPQHSLSRRRRTGNPVGAYRVVRPDALRDKTVWLVDDIVTTGATMNECARMLWLYGAREVTGICLCATMPDRKKKRDIRDDGSAAE